jgi:hypothetical protein
MKPALERGGNGKLMIDDNDPLDEFIDSSRRFLTWCEKWFDRIDSRTKGLYKSVKVSLKRYHNAKREGA